MGVKCVGGAKRGRCVWAATASALALTIGGAVVPQAAMAQTAPAGQIEFDIPAQDLNRALLAFTDRAGLQIFYDVDKVAGKRSSAVRGSYAPMEALSQSLVGTGLTFRVNGNRVTLEPAPRAAGGAIELGPVRVEGTEGTGGGYGVPPQAEIGNLPPVYAGGQIARGARVGALGNRDVMDADALDADLLAGALLDAVASKDAATREGWRKAGAAFFRGKQRKPSPRSERQPESSLPLEGGAASH